MRLTVAGILAASTVAWGHGAAASSAATTMGVSVTVVRSCAVQARPVNAVAADVRLACSAGHDSNVLVGTGQLTAPRSHFRVDHTEPSVDGTAGVRTITLNF